MTQYASLATHFDMDNIEIAMLPGAPNKHGYISYWILDPDKTQQVINRLIYREKFDGTKEEYTASIMSTSQKKEDAEILKSELEENGIKVICTGTSSSVHSQFIAHSNM
jgi:ABC-type transport system substrate-binding protein